MRAWPAAMLFAVAAASTSGEFVRTGLTWSPGPDAGIRVGVGNVRRDASGDAIMLFVGPTGPGGWAYEVYARQGQVLRYSGGAIRVGAITEPAPGASAAPGSEGHGGVALAAAEPGGAEDTSLAYLPEECTLRLGDSDPLKHEAVRIERFLPDANRPAAAVLAWTLEHLSFGLAKPEDYHRATVHPGSFLTIGGHRLEIRALLPRRADTPAALAVSFAPAS